METTDIEAQLKLLTETEAKILYMKCGGMNYRKIGVELRYSIQWVQLYASSMYAKLGFDKEMPPLERKKILQSVYCPIHKKLWESNPEWGPEEPEPNPPIRALMVVMQEEKEEEEEERRLAFAAPRDLARITQPVIRNRIPWWIWLILAGGIAISGTVFYFVGRSVEPQIIGFAATPTTANTTLPTTAVPLILPSSTSRPIYTPFPTETPVPTPTVTWTPLPTQEVLVETKFTDGIGPWNVTGPYAIQDGSITSDGSKPITLSIGDSSWKDYKLSVSFTHLDTGSCDMYMGVRIGDDGRGMLLGVVRAARLGWFKDVWSYAGWIKNNEALITDVAPVVDIIVKGDSFNWVGGTSVTLPGYPAGGVKIYFLCDKIDAIKITKIP